MTYNTSLTFDSNSLTCVIHGKRSLADSQIMWSEILKQIERQPVKYVLLDMHLSGRLHPNEILTGVESLYPKLIQKKLQVLVVDNNPESYHDNYLASILAEDKNIPVTLFNTFIEANKWLSEHRIND